METFWSSFEKQAKKSSILEQLRKGKRVKFKGQSIKGLAYTRLGKILRGLK